jgi:hypothetical protein
MSKSRALAKEGKSYSLLENGRIGVCHSISDLLLSGVWAYYAVLTLSGCLRVPPEIRLEVLVLVDRCLQPAVHLADLRRVSGVARVGLRFDVLDARDEGAVARHDLGAEAVDLARGHVWPRQGLPEDAVKVGELGVELIEGAVDFTAFVEDGIGVCAAAAAAALEVLHLHITWLC